eukprot:scaffold97252_cov64-Phaeocystis_antarctica.AAC.6
MKARTKERMSFSRCGTLSTSADGSSELWVSDSTAARSRRGVGRAGGARQGTCSLEAWWRTVHPRESPSVS